MIRTLARRRAARAAAACLTSAALLLASDARAASIRLDAGAVVLGRTESVSVAIAVDEPDGGAEHPLRLAVNVGSFSEPTRIGPGRYTAVYVPPPTRFPQVALVAVWKETGPDAPIEFLRIPLFGMTRIQATAAPQAMVQVKAGLDEFGPVRANRRGRAEVPITVAPGVSQCDVTIAEPGASPVTKRVPVEVPPYNRLTAALVPHAVVTDGRSRVRLEVFYDLGGADVPADRIVVTPSVGTVTFQGATRGRYTYEYVPPPGTPAGAATFSVSVTGDPTATATARLTLGLPPPARIVVTPPARSVAPGSRETAIATALVLDAAGMGLAGLHVSGAANGQALPPAVDRGGGRYALPFQAPARYPPGGLVQLQVSAEGGGAKVTASVNWQLEAAPVPRSIAARIVPSPVPADGRTAATVTFDLRDAAGMPLPNAEFIAIASHGTVGKVHERGVGLYEATYVAPARLPDGETVLRVVDGSGALDRTLRLPLREATRRVLLGVGGGYALSPGAAAGPRASADVWVPFRIGGATLGAGVAASWGTAERTVGDASGTLRSVTRAAFVPIALRLGYEVAAGRRASLTVGGGGVAAFGRFESSLVSATATGWAPGWLAFAGAAWAVGPGHAFAEASFASAVIETERYRLDPGGLSGTLGYRVAVF